MERNLSYKLLAILIAIITCSLLLQTEASAAINGGIAFVSSRDSNAEIYVMNVDGSGQKRLTNNNENDLYPNWYPDGTRIVFTSERDGNSEIYVMNSDGSGQVRLTNNNAIDSYPCWSPDGAKIVFMSVRDGDWEIYVMNSDGSSQTRLTRSPGDDAYPAWSSDGKKIAFSSQRDGNWEVYTMNADGSAQTRLTKTDSSDFVDDMDLYSSWSPDGTKIAFSSHRDGNWEIYLMNADGSEPTRLTNNSYDDEWPSWSPDGTKIAFQSNRNGTSDIYIMNIDGSSETKITSLSGNNVEPNWQSLPEPTTLSIELSTAQLNLGSDITVTGNISPPISGRTVILSYTSPKGTKVNKLVLTSQDGIFSDTYTPDTAGMWMVNASWAGDMKYLGSTSITLSFKVIPSLVTFQKANIDSILSASILTVDGKSYLTGELPKTFSWALMSKHTFSWLSPLVASEEKRYIWSSTSGLSTRQLGEILVPAGNSSVAANYITQYHITFQQSSGGTANPKSGWYNASSIVNLSPTIKSGYKFSNWTITSLLSIENSTSTNTNLTVNGPGTVTVNFKQTDFTPPTIADMNPANNSTITTGSVTLSASYSDDAAIDSSSVVLKVDGTVITAGFTATSIGVQYSINLPEGTHKVELMVKDTLGNIQTSSWIFRVQFPPNGINYEYIIALATALAILVFIVILLFRRKKEE